LEDELRLRFGSLVLVLGCTCGVVFAQAPASNASTASGDGSVATFRATSRLVLVDVVVTDKKGAFIQDLKPGDFTVLEDGKPQRISAFGRHSSSRTAAPEEKFHLPPNQYTNFTTQQPDRPITIILLDMLNTERMDQSYARDQMTKFLQQLPSGEPMALFVMRNNLAMLQSFTEDSDKLIAAAKALRGYKSPLMGSESELEEAEYQASLGRGSTTTINNGLLNLLYNEASFLSDQRARVTLESLSTLAQSVSGYSGRKNLIWLTGGIPFFIGHDLNTTSSQPERDYFDALHRVQSQMASNQIAVYPIDVRGLLTLSPAIQNFPRGVELPATSRSAVNLEYTQTAMRDIAGETGGKSFSSTNDLKAAMRESLQEGMNYYTLAYVPENRNWNGLYRKIEVKNTHPGAKLISRRGYYAISEKPFTGDESAKMLASAVQPTLPLLTMLLIRVQVLLPDADHKALRIDYAVSPDGVTFTDGADQHKEINIDFMAVAWDKDRKDAGYIQNTIEASLQAAEYKKELRTGIPMHQELELKPGSYTLKLGVIDRGSQKVGTVEVPITIVTSVATSAHP
jgi:VWFA-related protein